MTDDKLDAPGLFIEYRGDPSLPYGRDATRLAQPFKYIIFHYTGSEAPFENIVRYTLSIDRQRKAQFGYHFLINQDGLIVQAAPLSKRTNANAIGVALHNLKETPTAAQMKAGMSLALVLAERFGIAREHHYGHGEINKHKAADEGITLARLMRF
jgi:N-acetyl-anhydromuramyl-L-alanine amidase AmpD